MVAGRAADARKSSRLAKATLEPPPATTTTLLETTPPSRISSRNNHPSLPETNTLLEQLLERTEIAKRYFVLPQADGPCATFN